jgi:hypothetical protein
MSEFVLPGPCEKQRPDAFDSRMYLEIIPIQVRILYFTFRQASRRSKRLLTSSLDMNKSYVKEYFEAER